MTNVLAGYEIGTGAAVHIPVAHTVITGQSQGSGKTTALEAFVERSGMKAIAFITKRGEGSFQYGTPIAPYFRESADWEFVKSLFEKVTDSSKDSMEAAIIRMCDGAKTLQQVWDRVRKAQEKSPKRSQDLYVRMDAYFAKIIPALEKLPRATRLELHKGVNVTDLLPYEHNVQELVIHNVLEWVYQHEQATIVIMPEAWRFVPEDHHTAVTRSAREFIRQGAGLRNFLWFDCQDLRGVDKVLVGQCPVLLFGIQKEMNEVSRTIRSLGRFPEPPTETEMMTLGRGEFFVLHNAERQKIYVQPVWADPHTCAMYAKKRDANGRPLLALPKIPPPPPVRKTERDDEAMWKEKYDELKAQYDELVEAHDATAAEVKRLLALIEEKGIAPKSNGKGLVPPKSQSGVRSAPAGAADLEQIYTYFRIRLMDDPQILAAAAARPEITVRLERRTLELDGGSLDGRIAQLIAEKFFDDPKDNLSAMAEFKRRGWLGKKTPNNLLDKPLHKISSMGFLVKEDSGYQAVPGMKCRIVEA